MEILAELLVAFVQIIGELIVQIVVEVLAEVGLRSIAEPFRRPRPLHPVLASIGYAILGAAAGGISLLIVPELFTRNPTLRIVNLCVTPIAAGLFMSAFGAWRRRRDQELIRIDRFACGFLFALAMGGIRFAFGK